MRKEARQTGWEGEKRRTRTKGRGAIKWKMEEIQVRKGWKIGWKRRSEKGRENEHVRRKKCQVGWKECEGCKYITRCVQKVR